MWDKITAELKQYLTKPAFQTFQSSIHFVSFDNSVLSLSVPNEFSKQWFIDKAEKIVRNYFRVEHDQQIMIEYTIDKNLIETNDDTEQLEIFNQPKKKNTSTLTLNPNYTFENFVAGDHNRLAYAAAQAIVKSPSKTYNPLFIYGSVGLGKTHLLHAIGLGILKKYPDYKIKLVSSEKFTNDLINAIKDKKTDAFRKSYRKVDVLLVDDIQFLAGKEQTQEEFFHTFNDLHSYNKQIILTSDRSPKDIPTLEERLRTRFEWGLIADIQAPELETRIAILRKKIEDNELPINNDVLNFIANQIPSNVREMEGALNRITAYASLLDTEITLSVAKNVIQDMIKLEPEKPLTIRDIQTKICNHFLISVDELISKNRSKNLAYARQLAMYLCRELTSYSLPKIGSEFGNRDHTTVIHACEKIKSLLSSDRETLQNIEILSTTIKGE